MNELEEAKAEYEALKAAALDADKKAREARERYAELVRAAKLKEFADRGIVPGSKVVVTVKNYKGTTRRVVGFLGFKGGFWGRADPVFSKLKKDGTPSRQKIHVYAEKIEPFEGSPESKS